MPVPSKSYLSGRGDCLRHGAEEYSMFERTVQIRQFPHSHHSQFQSRGLAACFIYISASIYIAGDPNDWGRQTAHGAGKGW